MKRYCYILYIFLFLTSTQCKPEDPNPDPIPSNPFGDGNGQISFWAKSDLGAGKINIYLDNQPYGTIDHFHSNGITCGKADVNIIKPAGIYAWTAIGQNGMTWSSNVNFIESKCNNLELTSTSSSNPPQSNNCEWCHNSSCVEVKAWRKGNGSCQFYTQVTNKSNRTVTYQVCVPRTNGTWDCNIWSIGAGKTGPEIYYCDVPASPQVKYWAAYGQGNSCNWPDP